MENTRRNGIAIKFSWNELNKSINKNIFRQFVTNNNNVIWNCPRQFNTFLNVLVKRQSHERPVETPVELNDSVTGRPIGASWDKCWALLSTSTLTLSLVVELSSAVVLHLKNSALMDNRNFFCRIGYKKTLIQLVEEINNNCPSHKTAVTYSSHCAQKHAI